MKAFSIFKIISEILCVVIFFSGCIVLFGWILDIPVLKSISPQLVTMKANTSICFIFIGVSLWLYQEKRRNNRLGLWIARFLTSIIFLIGFLTFLEYVFKCNFGIDQILFKEPSTAILTSSPGRMAYNTSFNFVLVSVALFMIEARSAVFLYIAQFAVIFVGLIALLSLVGYLYGASPLYIGLHFSTAMALHTTVLFLMICICYLFMNSQKAFMKNVSSDNYGSIVLRRIFPVAIIVPLFFGWMKIYAEKKGWFSPELGVAFVAIFNLSVIGLFIYILSAYLNRLDVRRKRAEDELQLAYTKLTETQERLIHTEKMDAIGRLASGVAHEVKNPLGIVLQGVEYLQNVEVLTKGQHAEVLQMILFNIKRADNIVRGLVDFSRVDTFHAKPEDINEVIKSSIGLIQHEVKAHSVEIIQELQDNLPKAMVASGNMRQVFINLFINALQAMPQGGKLFIRTSQIKIDKEVIKKNNVFFHLGEGALLVEVEDTGVGISEENLPKITEPFFTTKGPHMGTGLGLSISNSIIEVHRGILDIQSEEGKGTKVSVILKIAGTDI